jgi:putative cell wall-binding protein
MTVPSARRWARHALRSAAVALLAMATAIALVPTGPIAPAAADDRPPPDDDPWPELTPGDSPWAQQYVDPQGTRRAKVAGPDDPGVKWFVDLADAETSFAPEGYGVAGGLSRARGPALVAPTDGTLIRTAVNQAPQYDRDRFGRELIGIDPDDGSVKWEIAHASTEHSRCLPAIDSQDRLWVYRYEWSEDPRVVQAFDPSTGTSLGPAFDLRVDDELLSHCRRTSLHIGGEGANERLVVFGHGGDPNEVLALDISGDAPVIAWQGVPGAATDHDQVTGVPVTQDRRQIAVFTDDSMIIALRSGIDTDAEMLELVELSLADGSVVSRLELPTPDPDDDESIHSSDYSRLDMLIAYDDTLVVASRGGSPGFIAGIDLTDGMSERWATRLLSGTSPSQMALGAGVVMTQPSGAGGLAGQNRAIWGFRVSDGVASWRGVTLHANMISDAAGSAYTTLRASGTARPRYLASMYPTGEERWRISRSAVADAVGVDDFDDLNLGSFDGRIKYGPIDADGTLYIQSESATGLLALDNSGGLADIQPPPDDPAQPEDPPSRVSGADRFATAADTCSAFVSPGPATVYIATGLQFPDALAGGVAAAAGPTCMLLTLADNLPSPTVAELERLQPESITVLGGTAAISNTVMGQLGEHTDGPVTRLQGVDRFATAATISQSAFTPGATNVAFVATGLNYPDALAGVPAAARFGGPILLTATDSIPDPTAAELSRLDLDRIYVLGGSAVVSDTVLTQLRQYAGTVLRVAGVDRFDTAVQTGQLLLSQGRPDPLTAFVATGVAFPDALAGGAIAGALGAPIYLVTQHDAPEVVTDELTRVAPDRMVVLGGTGAVSAANEQRLRDAAESEEPSDPDPSPPPSDDPNGDDDDDGPDVTAGQSCYEVAEGTAFDEQAQTVAEPRADVTEVCLTYEEDEVMVRTRMVDMADPDTEQGTGEGWGNEQTWINHALITREEQFGEPDWNLRIHLMDGTFRWDLYEHMAVGDLPECWGEAEYEESGGVAWYVATVGTDADCLDSPDVVGTDVHASYWDGERRLQDRHPGQDTAYFEPFVTPGD